MALVTIELAVTLGQPGPQVHPPAGQHQLWDTLDSSASCPRIQPHSPAGQYQFFWYTRTCSQLYLERAPRTSRPKLDLGCSWILSSICLSTFVSKTAPSACHWAGVDVPWTRCTIRTTVPSGSPKFLQKQTWVHSSAHSKVNLLMLCCGERKCSVYCRYQTRSTVG